MFSALGFYLDSKLVSIRPEDKEIRHFDFFPLINARTHQVGDKIKHWALNKNIRTTYENFLKAMAQKRGMDNAEML